MALPDKTFANCFRKCGVSEEAAASVIADGGNPFAGLEEDEEDLVKNLATNLDSFRMNYSDQVDTYLVIDEYIDFDR